MKMTSEELAKVVGWKSKELIKFEFLSLMCPFGLGLSFGIMWYVLHGHWVNLLLGIVGVIMFAVGLYFRRKAKKVRKIDWAERQRIIEGIRSIAIAHIKLRAKQEVERRKNVNS